MRSLREQPRVVAARILGAALLLGVGVALGALAHDRGAEPAPGTQEQLDRAKQASRTRADLLEQTTAALRRLRVQRGGTLRDTRRLARANARLRRANRTLRRAQRALRDQAP